MGQTPRRDATDADEHLVDALVAASRALVALAARTLAELDGEVTLPQFRALVVLAAGGPRRSIEISNELQVNPSTGTRMCDRLVRKGLVRRVRTGSDRRVVRLTLTPRGRELVAAVTKRRREQLGAVVSAVPRKNRAALTSSLKAFALAVHEVPDDQWWLGWQDTTPDD